jgi:two-component system response regulator YesN
LNIKPFEASNGLAAYEMILKVKFDIVLLDIKMPGLNGLELIEKVKTSISDIDITFIILSGYAEFSFASQAMKFGVKYYLLKPTDVQDIVSTLEKVILERREKNASHNKVTSLFSIISTYVGECNLEAAREQMDKLFDILKEDEIKERNIDYCIELFIMIIRQCKDYQQIPKFLRSSNEIQINTPLEAIYNLILKAIIEIININDNVNSQKYSKCIRLAIEYINENISNEELSLSYLSKHLYMNSDYFGKLFKKELKENFNDYLSNIRIKKAQEFLQNDKNNKISDIAEKVGFGCNSQYFSQVFKKCTGYSPKEYKALFVNTKSII